ncbi:hypothetical protein GCM10022631_02200 [Deinococcus rubellus]
MPTCAPLATDLRYYSARRIAPSTRDRSLGLQRLYPELRFFDTRGSPQDVMQLGNQALREGRDALIVTDDAMLTGLLKALKGAGKRVPDIGGGGHGQRPLGFSRP